jgi:hypothetical protein
MKMALFLAMMVLSQVTAAAAPVSVPVVYFATEEPKECWTDGPGLVGRATGKPGCGFEAATVQAEAWVPLRLQVPSQCAPVRIEWAGNYKRFATSDDPSLFYVQFPATVPAGHVGAAIRGAGCTGSGETWITVLSPGT